MRLWIGTSGYSYPEWKGSFYPDDLPAAKMLAFYSERFPSVELNATFYRMPTDKLIDGWVKEAPEGFRFTMKAPRSINVAKPEASLSPLTFFLGRAAKLGQRRGALLFVLAPFVKKDVPMLKAFLATVPPGQRVTFEFRSPTWHDEEVFTVLSDAGVALCISDSEKITTPLVPTTSWGYVRLRDEGYDRRDLARWHERITSQPWEEAYVYFKHEDAGKGADLGTQLLAIAERK